MKTLSDSVLNKLTKPALIKTIKELYVENEILRKNAEHNDKVVNEARWGANIYKSRMYKAIEYIKDYDVFKKFSFPLMKRDEENQVKSSIEYEFDTSIKKELLDILQGNKEEENNGN